MGDKTWKKDQFFVGHVEKAWEDEEAIEWQDIEELAKGINKNTRLGAPNIMRDQVPFPRFKETMDYTNPLLGKHTNGPHTHLG